MFWSRILMSMALAALVTACVPRREPPPPAPLPQPVLPVRPPPPTPPAPADWRDLALTPGGWSYRAEGGVTYASFGAGTPAFVVRCDRPVGRVTLTRAGAASAAAMVLRTSYGARSLAASPSSAGLSTTLAATDRALDGIAFSRGRFTVEAAGLPMLVLPAWAEPGRVIEDCRG